MAAEMIAKVNGVAAVGELLEEFQREVANLLGRKNSRSFPGAQPVSFAKHHIQELKQKDYFVCEKTDGIRYLVYLTQNTPQDGGDQVVYLIDRKNNYYYVPGLFFPHHENNPDFAKFHVNTILDGELVEDRYADGRSTIKFLVFDLLVIDGKDLRERTLDKRLGYLKQHVLKPHQQWLSKFPEARKTQPFLLEDKKTEFSYALPRMFHEIIPQVKQLHGNDGLIFTCKDTYYESGTDPHILKWKPPEENTVDFLLHITWPTIEPDPNDPDQSWQEDFYAPPEDVGLFIYHGNNMDYSRVGSLHLTTDEWEDMKALDKPIQDSIVECYLEDVPPTNGVHTNGNDTATKRWRFHRFRDDKHDANHVSTFESVKMSIEDHVTEQDLLDHADEMRNAWKARDARRQSRAQ